MRFAFATHPLQEFGMHLHRTCRPVLSVACFGSATPLSIGLFTVPKLPCDPATQFSDVAMLGIAPVAIMANAATSICDQGRQHQARNRRQPERSDTEIRSQPG
jgi:hypothetical protein